jgi:hypothetical protein
VRRFVVRALLALPLLIVPVLAGPASAGGSVYPVPATIDATGGQDVTAQLNAFFQSVPDGSTITFPAGGRYRAEGTLLLLDRNDLTIEGHGSTFFTTTKGDRDRRHWKLQGGSNLTLRDIVVKGSNPNAGQDEGAWIYDLQGQHGFMLRGVQGALLQRVTVTDTYGDFVYLGKRFDDGSRQWSSHITIVDSRFERSGRQGVTFTGGEDVVFQHNYIAQAARSTFDIEPNTASEGARRVLIAENQIGPGQHLLLSAYGEGGIVSDITLQGNQLHGRQFNLIVNAPGRTRRTNINVIGNSTDKAYGGGYSASMVFKGVDGAVVRGNQLLFRVGQHQVVVASRESCGVQVGRDNVTRYAAQLFSTDYYRCGSDIR